MASWFSAVEKKWNKLWFKSRVFEPDFKKAKRPFYNLMMFPYPSAEGLHVGNMYAFVGSDIYGRFKRMQGYDVFEPIGLDGFGIHSENYALKVKKHPAKLAKITEKNFYRQLEMIGNGFSWEERLETYDPEYYKWTQWIFIQMFKKGLAYRKKSPVNWCPSCKTVLADEQVISGECERCGSKVVKKELEQWFFRITNYAERLLNDLEKIDWSEKVKIAQRNWIGRSEGAEIEFKIQNSNLKIKVFTTRPDTIFGATYMVLSPEHNLISNIKNQISNIREVEKYIKKARADGKEKTGVELKGIKAINPANKEEIPIWVADYVLGNVGTGAIMAVPAHDERDMEFAKKFNLPVSNAPLVDKNEIVKKVGGQKTVNYRLRDWLISRQRYWGPPIPMIFCEKCGWQPVPEKDLPVKLPYIKDYRPKGTGVSPLANVPKFYKTKCPKCKGPARRETDVSDTFLDSAWYFFRYLDSRNKKEIFSRQVAKKWLPVNMYIGGAEHAVLHLLYVRFITKVFHDWGLIDFSAKGGSASGGDEPFPKFRAHGLLIKDGAKMSKSRGNVVNPDSYIKKFGADALRMYLMFLGPFDQGGDFRDSGILGITRFLTRVKNLKIQNSPPKADPRLTDGQAPLAEKILHQSIKKVTEDIENLRYNTAISQLMILLNALEKHGAGRQAYEIFLRLLAPFAPYLSEELWQRLKAKSYKLKADSIHLALWPRYDEKKIKEETFSLVVQVNGRVRATIEVPLGISQNEAEKISLENENVKRYLAAKPKKIIFITNKLINFVI